MKYIYLLIFLLQSILTQAQVTEIDSLESVVASQNNDSLKVDNLIQLSTLYLGTDIQEALRYGRQAQILAKEIKYTKGEAFAFKAIGRSYFTQGKSREAVIEYQRSLALFDSIGFKAGIANILSNLGATYFNEGDDTKAIDFYLRSLKISEEINDKLRIGTALNNIGGVYNNKPATEEKALEYFLKALPIFEEIEYTDGIGLVSMNVGEVYLKEKLFDSAIKYFETSLKIYEGTIDATFPLTFLGKIYAEKGQYDQAYAYHNRAVSIAESLGAKYELAQSLSGLAETQRKDGKIPQSIRSYEQARKAGEEVNARQELKEVYEALADLYAQVGDFKKAFQYKSQLTMLKDSLYNNNNDKKIQQLQFNFDIEKKEAQIDLLNKDKALQDATIQRQRIINYAAGFSGFLLLLVAVGTYRRYKFIRKTNQIIKNERDRSKELLLNILPEETARELEANGSAKTRYYENVTVLFTDFKGFSTIAGKLSPQELVNELNDYFGMFDEIVGQFGLEKIKTIGDAYMCAGGIPVPNETHALSAVQAAIAMQNYMRKKNEERIERGEEGWELRVGIHTGPIVAGVVGKKKYAYDIWGDTVNIASRMESNGEPGKINISSSTYAFIKDKYECEHRGKIMAKNIGEVDMYFVQEEIGVPA